MNTHWTSGGKLRLLTLFTDLLEAVESAGTHPELVQPELIRECRAAVKRYRQTRSAAGKAARGKSGRKGVEISRDHWAEIDKLRRRGIV